MNEKAKVLSESTGFLWHFPSPECCEGWTAVAQGYLYSAPGLTTRSERLFSWARALLS